MATPEERFWAKVEKTDGCWWWRGAVSTNGYGSVCHRARTYTAHRLAYQLANGPFPPKLIVRHSCDNQLCVRPDHLKLGTQHDNMHDMISRGRAVYVRGARAGLARFTDAQADVVRRLSTLGATLEDLATLTGASRRCVYRVVRGLSYTSAA